MSSAFFSSQASTADTTWLRIWVFILWVGFFSERTVFLPALLILVCAGFHRADFFLGLLAFSGAALKESDFLPDL